MAAPPSDPAGGSERPARTAPPDPVLDSALASFQEGDYHAALDGFRRVLERPVAPGVITEYARAWRLWEKKRSVGEIDCSFEDAVAAGLIPVDRSAMYARWYGRLSAVVLRGPGFARPHHAETARYRVLTDHSEGMARYVAAQLEIAAERYRRILPLPKGDDDGRLNTVLLFSQRSEYFRYLTALLNDPETAHLSGGSFHPITRQLLLHLNRDLDHTKLVLHHEAFHQYLGESLSKSPAWFNEGLADYFGAKAVGGRHPIRVKALRTAVRENSVPAPRTLLLMDRATYMAARDRDLPRRARTVGRNYACSWALVHFLAEADGGARAHLLGEYLESLHKGADRRTAYETVFATLDQPALVAEFHAHAARLAGEEE